MFENCLSGGCRAIKMLIAEGGLMESGVEDGREGKTNSNSSVGKAHDRVQGNGGEEEGGKEKEVGGGGVERRGGVAGRRKREIKQGRHVWE